MSERGAAVSGEARRIAATLLHDVGKYAARTARNLPDPGSIAPRFVPMLLKDVYETHRGRPASARFDELVAELRALGIDDPRLAAARTALSTIDAQEPGARAGQPVSLAAVARAAIEVEQALRALAKDLAR